MKHTFKHEYRINDCIQTGVDNPIYKKIPYTRDPIHMRPNTHEVCNTRDAIHTRCYTHEILYTQDAIHTELYAHGTLCTRNLVTRLYIRLS